MFLNYSLTRDYQSITGDRITIFSVKIFNIALRFELIEIQFTFKCTKISYSPYKDNQEIALLLRHFNKS